MLKKRNVYIHLENICARRLLDIEKISDYLKLNGYRVVSSIQKAGNILIFGCAFNKKTEDESLKKIDELVKSGRNVIVLEGIADTQGEKLKSKWSINPAKIIKCGEFDKLDVFFANKCSLKDVEEVNKLYTPPAKWFGFSRKKQSGIYSVQVAHGCDDNCTYCGDKIVVKQLKSKPLDNCIDEIKKGIESGFEHIELLGDDVGAYGKDISLTIIDLLNEIMKLKGSFKLSMQEVNIKYLIENIGYLGNVLQHGKLKHLVIAFQSGNNRILKMMNRGYTREEVEKLISLLNRHKVSKRFHAIAGFPTETYEEFIETISMIENGNFSSGTLFKYDDRDYALSYKISPKVSEKEITRRLYDAAEILQKSNFTCEMLPDKLAVRK